jgi:hypothetical protein
VTFSDRRVVELVRISMIPVWESVAPVRVAVFELGDGRSVRGTVGGEIALYFCRPDGKVFDILPALHSPHVTYWAIKRALEFYLHTGATDESIAAHHQIRAAMMTREGRGELTTEIQKAKSDIRIRLNATDPGTRDMGLMAKSKAGGNFRGEHMALIEPGGLDYYKRRVHEILAASEPKTPDEWKKQIFEVILEQPMVGGVVKYDVNSLAPLSIIEGE